MTNEHKHIATAAINGEHEMSNVKSPLHWRKKPVVIEAIQYTGDNLQEVLDFTGKHPKWGDWFKDFEDYAAHVREDGRVFKILTLEGTMDAKPGDWIIRGVSGEHYPCKPDIFAATYEAAAALDDPYAALSQPPHGDGDALTAGGRLIASAAEAAVYAWRTRALVAEAKIERLTAERDEQRERAEEAESEITRAQEQVSAEFEGDCWKAMRKLLDVTEFDWSSYSDDGVTADDAHQWIVEELDRLEAERDTAWKAGAEAMRDAATWAAHDWAMSEKDGTFPHDAIRALPLPDQPKENA